MSDVKNAGVGTVVDIAGWRMGDYADFFGAGNKNDFELQFALISKIVKSWSYDGSPSEAASFRNLTVTEWQECLTAVGNAITAQFQKGN